MSQESNVTKCCPIAKQVWVCLAVDQRAQAIRLMAQMTFNYVVAQVTAFDQERKHVSPNRPEDSA